MPKQRPEATPIWLKYAIIGVATALAMVVAFDAGRLIRSKTEGTATASVAADNVSGSQFEGDTAQSAAGADDVADGEAGSASAASVNDGAIATEPEVRSGWGPVDGLLTFRGNPSRNFHGVGPVPTNPEVVWSATIGCSNSFVGSEATEWCGTGWTGQPLVFPKDDQWWVAVGGYNRSINFFDPETGAVVYPEFETDDIIKGTATVDPDGFPLLYTGSRDNYMHVVALDGPEPRELWRLSAESDEPTLWNNDWDGSPLIIDDMMIVGGENSRFYVVKLNRSYMSDGQVAVDPEVVFSTAGWDDELLTALGDHQVSIENSVAVHDSVAYFANSGGLVQGWDLTPLVDGRDPQRVFRYWVGDDTDATVVVGDDGDLYVASEYERGTARSRELGQVFRLDPSKPTDPLVWSVEANSGLETGVWATPALWDDLVLVATDDGRVMALEQATGATRWTLRFTGPVWSSPVVVDDVLIQGDCTVGLQAFDLSSSGQERVPELLWSVSLNGCVESTPAVWNGRIFVGTRAGTFYALADNQDG